MINGKNMFTYKIRKIGIKKEDNIVPDDPSNIFEFTNKKRKMINFDDLLGRKSKPVLQEISSKQEDKKVGRPKKNLSTISKSTTSKSTTRESKATKKNDDTKTKQIAHKQFRKINISDIQLVSKTKKPVAEDINNIRVPLTELSIENPKKVPVTSFPSVSTFLDDSIEVRNVKHAEIPLKKENVVEEPSVKIVDDVASMTISDCSSINDLLLLFCLNNSSAYSKKLKDMVLKNRDLFNNVYETEIIDIEKKIEEVDTQRDKWCKTKKVVLEENIIQIPTYTKKIEKLEDIEEKENVDTSKISFIKENMKSYLGNLNDRLNEVEQKIFNLTANDKEMDPIILLNALTKYN